MSTVYHSAYDVLLPPPKLKPHPKNPKKHPKRQIATLAEIIKKLGWRHSVIVSRLSGYIVAGHARVDAARKLKCSVPVAYQNFEDAAEELAFLMADNIIPELAEYDEALKLENLEELKVLDLDFDLAPIDVEIAQIGETFDAPAPPEKVDEVYGLYEDAIFSSSNEWGIPDLLPERLAPRSSAPTSVWAPGNQLEGSLVLYGSRALPDKAAGSVLAFYVEDFRFERVWSEAVTTVQRFKEVGFQAIIAPDFSVWREDPLPVQLWARYRSMWVARYWQAVGVDVIPSLNWSDGRSIEFCSAGIPEGVPLVSVQCRTTKTKEGRGFFQEGLLRTLAKVKPKACIIYGGEQNNKWIPEVDGVEMILLSDFTRERRKAGL